MVFFGSFLLKYIYSGISIYFCANIVTFGSFLAELFISSFFGHHTLGGPRLGAGLSDKTSYPPNVNPDNTNTSASGLTANRPNLAEFSEALQQECNKKTNNKLPDVNPLDKALRSSENEYKR